MSRTVYIARKGQILVALSDDEYSDGKLRFDGDIVDMAPYYAEKPLHDWETDAMHVFSRFVVRVLREVGWEYNGSSSWDSSDPEVGMTVAVYESRIPDFSGEELGTLEMHPDTIFHGYVSFNDQATRYSNAVVDLADIAAPREDASESRVKAAVNAVYNEAREYNDPLADIVDALVDTEWDYDRSVGELVRRMPEAA